DEVGRVPNGAQALAHLLALPGAPLILLALGCHLLLGLLQTRDCFGGAARAASFRWGVDGLLMRLHTAARLCSRRHGRRWGTLVGSHWSGHSLAPLVLHMAEVWRVRRAEGMGHIREEPWRLLTGRLAPLPCEQCPGVLQQGVPGGVSPCRGRLLAQDRVAHG